MINFRVRQNCERNETEQTVDPLPQEEDLQMENENIQQEENNNQQQMRETRT